jgi:ribonuclease P protein component
MELYGGLVVNDERLKKSSQFTLVYKKGKSEVTRFMVMYYLKNGFEYNRIGYSVSKKVGNSVVRNRSKRLMKEAVRLNSENLKSGYDIVFISRVKMNSATYKDAEKSVKKLMKPLH